MVSYLKYQAMMEMLLVQANTLCYFDKELILAQCMPLLSCLGGNSGGTNKPTSIFYTDLIIAIYRKQYIF